MVFPFLSFIAATSLFGLNLKVWMYLSLLTLVASAWVPLMNLRVARTRTDGLLFVVGALFVFSFRQYENIMSSWQLSLNLCQFCAIAVFHCLSLNKQTQCVFLAKFFAIVVKQATAHHCDTQHTRTPRAQP